MSLVPPAVQQRPGVVAVRAERMASKLLFRRSVMFRTLALVPLFSLLLSPAFADEPKPKVKPAGELLAAGAAQAKAEGKKVFLLFGSPG